MCLVVEYFKKSVKSDYLGVIICNWWRRVRKSGYSLPKMQNTLKIHTKTPKTQDFRQKLYSLSILHAQYTENSGHLMIFFQKIGKFAKLSVQLTSNFTLLVENSEKSEFSAKWERIFKY